MVSMCLEKPIHVLHLSLRSFPNAAFEIVLMYLTHAITVYDVIYTYCWAQKMAALWDIVL